MKVNIVGREYNISKKLEQIIISKISKLDRYFYDDAEVKITCRLDNKNSYKMEILVISRKMVYRAVVSNNENMYANIDIALPKLEKQIIKYKEKLRDKLKMSAFEKGGYEFIEDGIKTDDKHKVVKTKHFEIGESISVEEAQTKLEMLGYNFFVYKNNENDSVNIMYKREDGNYGNIQIEE